MKILLLFVSLSAQAFTVSTLTGTSDLNLKLRPIKNKRFRFKDAKPIVRKNRLKSILKDYKNRLNGEFDIPKYFYPNSYFWMNVYANYDSGQIMIHNKNHLDLIYKAIDFHELEEIGLSEIERYVLQAELSQRFVNKLKIKILANDDDFEDLYEDAGIKIPSKGKKLNRKLANLALNLRIQTGQRDAFKKGYIRSLKYQKNILNILKEFDLPKSLLAIPFLESSFNVEAKSKVGASGIWQIMPFIKRRIFKKEKGIEYTDNIYISSLGALKLFRENHTILKRWDTAITAYNSGVKHILDASKKLKIPKQDLSLETMFKKYDNDNHGFASVNFYAGFLALSRILNYQEELFPNVSRKIRDNEPLVSFYVNKCSTRTNQFFKAFKNAKQMRELNKHIQSRRFQKGNILVSTVNLSKRRYQKVNINKFKYNYPRVYGKKRYRCSTR